METGIHYTTGSSLLGDGVRVLTRTMRRIAEIASRAGTRLLYRTRAIEEGTMEVPATTGIVTSV